MPWFTKTSLAKRIIMTLVTNLNGSKTVAMLLKAINSSMSLRETYFGFFFSSKKKKSKINR